MKSKLTVEFSFNQQIYAWQNALVNSEAEFVCNIRFKHGFDTHQTNYVTKSGDQTSGVKFPILLRNFSQKPGATIHAHP